MISTQTALGAQADLEWVVKQWPRLRAALRPGGGNALTGMPSSNEQPSPIDLSVSDLMHEIATAAAFYAEALLTETNDFRLSTLDMPGLLAAVTQRHGHFTADDDEKVALDFCDWAHESRNRVHKALERPAPPTYLGPCPQDECDGELYVREGQTFARCRECGRETGILEQREWLHGQMEALLLTPAEIVRALKVLGHKVPPGTVKTWVSRGRLVEAVDGLYRLAEAVALAETRRSKLLLRTG